MDSSARNRPKIVDVMKQKIGERRVINMCAFKTETPKSCVQVVCRGLEIPNEDGQYLASLIPVERGKQYSFKECFEGNEEENRKPVKEFINEIERLTTLHNKSIKEMLFLLEGIVSAKTIHASALLVTQEDYTEMYASMRAPNGTMVTAFEAHDIEYMGGLKEDMLTIECLDKIEVCMELLMRDGYMEWQGDWKSTFLKYVHPSVLQLTNDEIWDKICNGEVMNLFQFETSIGVDCITRLKPHNLYDIGVCNSIMRITTDGELPIDKYYKFKNDISLWYKEMKEQSLNDDEVKVMEKHLLKVYGVTTTQEEIMLLSMDESIANFDLTMANKLRKACAKRNPKVQEEIKNSFFESGLKKGNRIEMLNYVWEFCITPLLQYAFSAPHVYSYSLNGFIEAQLCTLYPSLYWDCSCLTVNAQAVEDDEEEDEDTEEDEQKKSKTTKYDKIAKALGDIKQRGVTVSPPLVSSAKFSFEPDIKNNRIIYSLKAVNGISDDTAKLIVQNQPYASLEEFTSKVNPKKGEMIALIKSGALDEFDTDREKLMRDYISSYVGLKTKLGTANTPFMVTNKLIPKELSFCGRLVKYKKYVLNKSNFYEIDEASAHLKKPKKWYLLDSIAEDFFNEYLIDCMEEGVSYNYANTGIIVRDKEFNDAIKSKLIDLDKWIKTDEAVNIFNDFVLKEEINKKASGNTSKWEMESLCSYLTRPHELAHIDLEAYSVGNFKELSEEPIKIGDYTWRGRTYDVYELTRVVGSVIATNNTRHTITILDVFGNVFDLKLYSGAYSHYSKQISRVNPDGSKTIIEKPWTKRGNLIMAYGFRQGNGQFRLKKYKDSPVQHTLSLITKVTDDGYLVTKDERELSN